jgi:selenocysteine-specific elongation factor
MSKHVIIGTAGHIDHGKSALVEALTGTHPDRLEEEKRRGITIDLGYAFLEMDGVQIAFVDVPGHEKFVRNMLAGAGGIDMVLLVVAADESIKPQTREHFEICRLLGIQRGIIAITKSDLVDAEVLGLVKLEIEEFVRSSFLESAPIIAVSARTGAGLGDLKREMLRRAASAPERDASRYARLPIDRAFSMQGFGTVATGTLISGTLRPEQQVVLLPAGKRSRIRGLHSGGRAVHQAIAGQRTAVNLADINVAEIERGMVLATEGVFCPTNRLDARVSLLSSARPLKSRSRVHFHCGAAERIAVMTLLDADHLAANATALAQLHLDAPVVALPGDRFIIRQFSPVITIGGGVVLDALAPRHKKHSPSTMELLAKLEHGAPEQILAALVAEDPRGVDLARIIARTGWLEVEVRQIARSLGLAKTIQVASEQPWVAVSSQAMQTLMGNIEKEIERFHANNPLIPGIAKQDLRGRVAPRVHPEVFRAAVDELVRHEKIAIAGDTVQRARREIALSPEELRAKEQIAREFERAGLSAPSADEALKRAPVDLQRARKLLQLLIREKILVKVTEELIFHKAALENLRALLAAYKRAHGDRLPIAAFKELAGISRKHAIPLLEYMDRIQLTRRAGDERVIL